MKNMKKLTAVISTTILLFLCAVFVMAADTVDSGKCGDNLTWSLDSEGTLTVNGNGDMWELINPSTGEMLSDEELYSLGRSNYWIDWYNFNESVNKIIIKSGVTSIANSAFGFQNLETVTIADSVTKIGAGAFMDCRSLSSIRLPKNLKSIDTSTFRGCKALTNVEIPSKVETIAWGAFAYSGLESLRIPNSVKTIESQAFEECKKLESITIGSGVETIEDYAFDASTSLEKFIVVDNNPSYSSDETGCLYNKDKTVIVQYPFARQATSFSIPSSVKEIGTAAFCFAKNLQEINIPNSVRIIGAYSFDVCSSLKEIVIPSSVERIGENAFLWCDSLSDIYILNSACNIFSGENGDGTINRRATIHGYSNSTAEAYANKYNRTFIKLEDSDISVDQPDDIDQEIRLNFFQRIAAFFRNLFDRLFSIFRR